MMRPCRRRQSRYETDEEIMDIWAAVSKDVKARMFLEGAKDRRSAGEFRGRVHDSGSYGKGVR